MGLGNLILGYDENDGTDVKTGSHNLILGAHHSYSSTGGLVAGYDNSISGVSASVGGGRNNSAGGDYSSVSGGRANSNFLYDLATGKILDVKLTV